MNIGEMEVQYTIEAKICGSKEKRKVAYRLVDSYHNLCLDKKDIIMSELIACERLSNYTRDESDKRAIEREIAELKLTLDLLT